MAVLAMFININSALIHPARHKADWFTGLEMGYKTLNFAFLIQECHIISTY